MFGVQISYNKESVGFGSRRKNWKPAPQLGQRIAAGDTTLRSSNALNISSGISKLNLSTEPASAKVQPTHVCLKKLKVPDSPTSDGGTPLSPISAVSSQPAFVVPPIIVPPTVPTAPAYTNNPYSLELFTPPPPDTTSLVDIACNLVGADDLSAAREQLETDEHKIQQRLKQIGFGKSTKGYENYFTLVPKHLRDEENEDHPGTPRANQKCSKRSWDGQLKKWRRLLHRWDNVLGSASCSDSDSVGGGSEKDLFGSEDTLARSVGSSWSSSPDSKIDVMGEPRKRSWGSECSETPDFSDLTGFTTACDYANSYDRFYS